MISIGRGLRWTDPYHNDVHLAQKQGYQFLQVFYKRGQIDIADDLPDRASYIKEIGFPIILHALFRLEHFRKYGEDLLDVLSFLGHQEVIIHPICRGEEVGQHSIWDLATQVQFFAEEAEQRGLTIYLENNSMIDGLLCTPQDLAIVFGHNPNVQFLLDVAHVESYEHLEKLIAVRYPRCLHVAGKHFHIPHEHLPLNQGDIDYNLVFAKYLREYQGRVILETMGSEQVLLDCRRILDSALAQIK